MTKVEIKKGKTGDVKFNKKGDRDMPIYKIVNKYQDEYGKVYEKEVGQYGVSRVGCFCALLIKLFKKKP